MVKPALLDVEVVYAGHQRQKLVALSINEGATIEEAILKSGLLNEFPEINLSQFKVGVFSKIMPLTACVRDHDRVEIYHPLLIDPKNARKKRAKQQAQSK